MMPQKNPFQWDYSYSVCSLLSCLKVPLDVFPHRYCLTDQNRWSSLIICYHHWGHAHMDWDNPHSKPPFYDYFTYFIGVIFLIMSWVIIHYHYIGVCSVSGHFSGAVIKQNSRTQNHWKSEPAKEEVLAFYCILLIDTSHFHISNFTIGFGILRNLFPVKMAWINRWQAGKCWHFLFAERNSKKEATYNYTIVFCISWNPLPVKTPWINQ